MEIIEKINLIMLEKKIKNKDVAAFLNLKPQLVSDWRSGRSRSYEKYLPQLAAFFGVKVDYFVNNGPLNFNGAQNSEKGAGEEELLRKYNLHSEKGKKKAIEYIDDLVFNPDNVDDNFRYMLATAAFDGRYTTEKIPYSTKEVKSILESDEIEGEDF